jgi:hypothetical protein
MTRFKWKGKKRNKNKFKSIDLYVRYGASQNKIKIEKPKAPQANGFEVKPPPPPPLPPRKKERNIVGLREAADDDGKLLVKDVGGVPIGRCARISSTVMAM